MTQLPLDPALARRRARQRVVVKNIVGLALLILGVAGLLATVWAIEPLGLVALACCGAIVGGYVWATTDDGGV